MKGYKINNIETLCSFIMAEKPKKKVNELIWHLGIKAIIMDGAEPEKNCTYHLNLQLTIGKNFNICYIRAENHKSIK